MPSVTVTPSDVFEPGFSGSTATSAYFTALTLIPVTSYANADTNFAALQAWANALTAALLERRNVAAS